MKMCRLFKARVRWMPLRSIDSLMSAPHQQGARGARRDQLYGGSLLLSPISFEDRAVAVISIIGRPCKLPLTLTLEVVKSRNELVCQGCSRSVSVCCECCKCA